MTMAAPRRSRDRRGGGHLGAVACSWSPFRDFQLADVAVYVVAIAGLTVLIGLSGQISLGNGAFMAIGAYATALLLTAPELAAVGVCSRPARRSRPWPGRRWAWPPPGCAVPTWPGPPCCWRWPCPRSRPVPRVFGGDQGLCVNVTAPAALGATFPPTRWLAWINAGRGADHAGPAGQPGPQPDRPQLARDPGRRGGRRPGRPERGPAADPRVRGERGLRGRWPVPCSRSTACLVSPGSFTVTLSIALLTGAVIGGLGSLAGALWGSLVIVLVPTYVTDVATSHGLSSAVAANIPIAAYGVVLIAVMLIFPEGIQGGLRRFWGHHPARRRRSRIRPPQFLAPASAGQRTPGRRHHMNRSHRVRLLAVVAAAVAAAALVAAGCGGGSSTSSSSGAADRVRPWHHREPDPDRQPPAAHRPGRPRLQRDRARRPTPTSSTSTPTAGSTAARSSTPTSTTGTTPPRP